jgi:predicted O-methyltransferase YrrM
MRPMARIRSRFEKTLELALHVARAVADRRELARLAETSPTARALLAVAYRRFTSEERRTFAAIERVRAQLYDRRDDYVWSVENPVNPASVPAAETQIVGEWARKSSTRPHWGRLLYALVREIRPETCLELGACFGMSGQYILAAMRHVGRGKLQTMEGSRRRAEIAAEAFRALGHENFDIEVGDFDRTLEPLLERTGVIDLAFIDGNHRQEATTRYDAMVRSRMQPGGFLVHDDIRWSGEMAAAWAEIAARPARIIFDVFRMGVVELGASDRHVAPIPAWLGLDQLR